ncbi:MFS transporter [Streptomyces sp. NPDC000987]|uniref:MFS transporter n=1 Tax=Streptomyces sp. NPDC000987 TaxID=3154374 RepID=UPI0033328E42
MHEVTSRQSTSSGPVRWALAAESASAFGTGMTGPLLVIYLHSARGLPLGLATVVGGVSALISLLGNPSGGVLTDRFGPWRTAAGGLVVAALGTAALGVAGQLWQILLAVGVGGLGLSVSMPAQDTVLGRLSPEHRSRVFALRSLVFNAGLGVGALAGTVVIDRQNPASFTVAYVCDALTFLVALCCLAPLRHVAGRGSGGSRTPWISPIPADPRLLRLCALQVVFTVVGLGQIQYAFAGWIEYHDASPRLMSLAFLANVATVVIVQMPALRVTRGRLRTRLMAGMCVCLALVWLVTLVSGGRSQLSMGALLAIAAALLGLGEILHAISLPSLVNELAPEELRGRYNGAVILAGTTGMILGPVITGGLLQLNRPYLLMMILAGAALGAAALCLRLERHVPRAANAVDG